MAKTFHILNGDALEVRFPEGLAGELIIARECLMDGPVNFSDWNDFYQARARFIEGYGGGVNKEMYYKGSVGEFEKISTIEAGADINLWFEDDLFCQVNLWFICHLIDESDMSYNVYLVRPIEGCEYNFGAMNKAQLELSFQDRIPLGTEGLKLMSQLWSLYKREAVYGYGDMQVKRMWRDYMDKKD